LVGFGLNSLGFLIYLALTNAGMHPVVVVSIFYPMSVFFGFLSHRKLTFQRQERQLQGWVFSRYILVYVVGYLMNLLMLNVLYEKYGFPHEYVQLLSIFTIAFFLYVSMKKFVFKE
jgi:putative flippase GtrA